MALQLHRAPRADLLADRLAGLLARPLPDPFATEVVVVPARGVERWLSQRLSHRLGVGPVGGDGVCAGVEFLSPRSLVSLLLGRDRDDPWDPDRLVWPLLEVLDASLDEPWAAALASHLGHGLDGDEGELRRARRWSVARRLAGILASYSVQRPTLVTDWREGRDTDGAGSPLDHDLAWQPELWRRLLDRVDAVPPDVRHVDAMSRLRAGDRQALAGLELPDRLSLFGHTRLPVTEVELLVALGAHRDVHLWLPTPSPALSELLRGLGGVVARVDDPSAERVGHPLLASLGRDTRELSRVLDGAGAEVAETTALEERATLLGWLQHDLRANRAPDETLRASRVVAADDRSLQVHACHGPSRQVDVLREVLVGLLDDDPTLEPRDILVMCPDIETYAPLIAAGFGLEGVADDGHPAHRLRVRLADRALSSTNPLLGVAARLVELAGGRVTASEVLDLAATDVVRRRFAFDDDDLARLTDWVGAAGIRWGLDAGQRAGFDMQGFAHNTWRSGLDRLLLGAAMSADGHRHVGRGLPVDDVGSGDLDLLGRVAELVHRLDRCVAALAAAGPLDTWVGGLREGVAGLTEVDPDQPWQVPQFERELARALDATGDGAVALRLPDVRALLRSRLGGRPTRANFRTGTLTVCTMVPMRSVPHRVVCLVGLDDGVFPRVGSVDGDDALLRRPLTGERDARSEDRQLLLDAVLAATETLVVTYTGANEHTGATRPPAVPLGEILDAAARTAATPGRVLVRHPLQPHDARNLEPGGLVGDRPFSFDAAALAGARAATAERHPAPPFLPDPLPPAPREDVNLADLRDFFAHPVRSFLRGRLELATPLEADDVVDAIPIEVRGLDKWRIGDRLLREVLAGSAPDVVMTAELLRGTLPPFRLGEVAFQSVVEECSAIYAATTGLREERTPASRDVAVDLGDGRLLTGTVGQLFGHRLLSVGYSALKGKQRLAVWIDLLALSAAHPDEHWTGHAVGKGARGADGYVSGPVDHRALDWLRTLVELYDEGRCRPLPIPVETALATASRRFGAPGSRGAQAAWASTDTSPVPGERDDAWHVRVYGERAPLQVLLDAGLDDLAARVWEPLLTGGERRVTL